MEDVFDARKQLLDKARFLFPVDKDRRFTYTCQADVPRFVVGELLTNDTVVRGALNFVAPGTFNLHEVEQALDARPSAADDVIPHPRG